MLIPRWYPCAKSGMLCRLYVAVASSIRQRESCDIGVRRAGIAAEEQLAPAGLAVHRGIEGWLGRILHSSRKVKAAGNCPNPTRRTTKATLSVGHHHLPNMKEPDGRTPRQTGR